MQSHLGQRTIKSAGVYGHITDQRRQAMPKLLAKSTAVARVRP